MVEIREREREKKESRDEGSVLEYQRRKVTKVS